MKVGISEYPLSNVLGFKEAMTYLHELGFDAIDYNFYSRNALFENEDWREVVSEVKKVCQANGLIISQMHANWFRFDDPNEDKEYFIKMNKRAIEVCELLDCPYLVMHAVKFTGYYASESIRDLANQYNLNLFATYQKIAEKHHVKIALENMFGYVTNTLIPAETIFSSAQQINEYIKILGSQFVACLDSGHAYVAKQDFPQMINELGDNLCVLHIHDAVLSDDTHLVPYLGHINWDAYLKAIAHCPNELVLSLELDIKNKVTIKAYLKFAKSVIDDMNQQLMEYRHQNK